DATRTHAPHPRPRRPGRHRRLRQSGVGDGGVGGFLSPPPVGEGAKAAFGRCYLNENADASHRPWRGEGGTGVSASYCIAPHPARDSPDAASHCDFAPSRGWMPVPIVIAVGLRQTAVEVSIVIVLLDMIDL